MGDAELLVVSELPDPGDVLPALVLLPQLVRMCEPEPTAAYVAGGYSVVLVDACRDVGVGKALCARFAATRNTRVAAVLREESLVALSPSWGIDAFFLPGAGPAEVATRLRLLRERPLEPVERSGALHSLGELTIDEPAYTAALRGRPLELTSQEFALLKFLTQRPGRVFSRAELLQQLWGGGSVEGTRTVDVHVRRLRAKLGPQHEHMIATVRKVGYKATAGGVDIHADFTARGSVHSAETGGGAGGNTALPRFRTTAYRGGSA